MKHLIAFLFIFVLCTQTAHSQDIETDHRFVFFDIQPGMSLNDADKKINEYGGNLTSYINNKNKNTKEKIYNFRAIVSKNNSRGAVDPRAEMMRKLQKIMPNISSSPDYVVTLYTYPMDLNAPVISAPDNLVVYMVETNIVQKETPQKKVKMPPHMAHLQPKQSHVFSLDELIKRINQHGVLTDAMYQGNNETRYALLWQDLADDSISPAFTADDVLNIPYVKNQRPALEHCIKTAPIATNIKSYAVSGFPDLATYLEKTLTQNPLPIWLSCGEMTHASILIKDKNKAPNGIQIIRYNVQALINAYAAFAKIN